MLAYERAFVRLHAKKSADRQTREEADVTVRRGPYNYVKNVHKILLTKMWIRIYVYMYTALERSRHIFVTWPSGRCRCHRKTREDVDVWTENVEPLTSEQNASAHVY